MLYYYWYAIMTCNRKNLSSHPLAKETVLQDLSFKIRTILQGFLKTGGDFFILELVRYLKSTNWREASQKTRPKDISCLILIQNFLSKLDLKKPFFNVGLLQTNPNEIWGQKFYQQMLNIITRVTPSSLCLFFSIVDISNTLRGIV